MAVNGTGRRLLHTAPSQGYTRAYAPTGASIEWTADIILRRGGIGESAAVVADPAPGQ